MSGRFYDRRVWRDRLQPNHLAREPLCRTCKQHGIIRVATHVDHVIPIPPSGNADPFDESNYQSLCLTCHTDKTNTDAGHVVKNRFGVDGFPLNDTHHWNVSVSTKEGL